MLMISALLDAEMLRTCIHVM